MAVRPTVCLSVRIENISYHRMDFYEIWYLRMFWNSAEKIQVLLKSEKNNLYFTRRRLFSHLWQYPAEFFLEWEMF
jgi:hypothetical protein